MDDTLFNMLLNYKLLKDSEGKTKELVKILNNHGIYGAEVCVLFLELSALGRATDDE